MKKSLSIILTILFAFVRFGASSQETCKVLKPEISEKYTGECKGGLAHGKGTAEGKDKYVGHFKKGMPSGDGIYTWSTGEIYDGAWREGNRDGEGKYTFKILGRDSISYGLWKDDKFVRIIVPDPYTVYKNSSIIRYSVKRLNDTPRVMVEFMQAGSNNSNISGLFFFATSGTTISVGNRTGYENVEFPVTCRISYRTTNALKSSSISCEFEIVIDQPGNWEITLYN